MKIIIDTNFLFSFFWNSNLIRKLILSEHEIYSPEFALEELESHKDEILEKTKLKKQEFEEFKRKLKKVVQFIPFSYYEKSIPKVYKLLPEHPKDMDFLALALEINGVILSKDKKLKEQNKIKVFNEKELSDLLN